jgi:hypothetical protein
MESRFKTLEAIVGRFVSIVGWSLNALAHLAGELTKCPTLVWLVPAPNQSVEPIVKEWAQYVFQRKFHLYFKCQHSFTPLNPPLELCIPRKWLVQVAPAALKITLFC